MIAAIPGTACGPMVPPPMLANSGGPASRTRKERIQATLLGREKGTVRCPRVRQIGLYFDFTEEPVEVMTRFLRRQGFRDPEELRREFAVPPGRLIAAPLPWTTWRINPAVDPPRAVLEQALLLGLCTANLYDPGRPVLWTRASLLRILELFEPEGFYA